MPAPIELVKNNIVSIPIDLEMIEEAEREEAERREKWGYGTREVINKEGKVVRRDLIGSLAHQAVEIYLDSLRVPYKSFRTVRYKSGDSTDIKYDGDSIDVKGNTRSLKNNYDYIKDFLVFQNQLDDPKMDDISHFCFVTVDPDLDRASIFGIISVGNFLRKSHKVVLQYVNRGISPMQLMCIRNYIFRI